MGTTRSPTVIPTSYMVIVLSSTLTTVAAGANTGDNSVFTGGAIVSSALAVPVLLSGTSSFTSIFFNVSVHVIGSASLRGTVTLGATSGTSGTTPIHATTTTSV